MILQNHESRNNSPSIVYATNSFSYNLQCTDTLTHAIPWSMTHTNKSNSHRQTVSTNCYLSHTAGCWCLGIQLQAGLTVKLQSACFTRERSRIVYLLRSQNDGLYFHHTLLCTSITTITCENISTLKKKKTDSV